MNPLALAWRNVVRHGRRSAIALAAITFGVVALILAGGFIEWIFVDFRESSIRAHLGHAQVTRRGYQEAGVAEPFGFLLPADDPALRAIAADPRTDLVAPRLSFSGLVSAGDSTLSFVGEGVDPAREAKLSQSMTIAAGKALAVDDPKGALLGEGLAANLGVSPGDTIVLIATTKSGTTNAVEMRVRGTFYTVTKAYDDTALRIPLATAQQLLRVEGAHRWVVLLRETASTPAVVGDLRKSLDGRQLEVTPWWTLADFYNKTVGLFSRQLGIVRFIVGIIIVLSISNTMIMSVLERTWEIGTSMAMGVTRRQIQTQFLVEGVLLGTIGGACGILLGAALAWLLTAIGIPMPPPPGMSHGFKGGVLFTPTLALGAFGIATGTTFLASLYPARKASRLPIVDALRHNR